MKILSKFSKKSFWNYVFRQIHYERTMWMIGVCLSTLFLPYVSNSQVCKTPNNNQAVLFQPCTWHIGN
ncbi:MAG: hypothetical protein QME52_09740, partial [Bacteroidota bacterium]|nr:hypothetical protein [Bacteroidota bacterium]